MEINREVEHFIPHLSHRFEILFSCMCKESKSLENINLEKSKNIPSFLKETHEAQAV